MGLRDKLNEDLKNAMKSGDKLRTETLRMLRAQILEFEKSGAGREMNADDDMKILLSSVKKRRDSIEMYEKANRKDLANKEIAEIAIVQEYLPKQMSAGEAEMIIVKIIAEAGSKELSKVMPLVMKELKGKLDGKLINEIVKQKIA
ncbi:MAG: GatB/YqeY domain-containing protein [Bacteriovoracaceae bacterium]|nr:GatB/YqeY domain-containing protein [Bacteroidota bacterium]